MPTSSKKKGPREEIMLLSCLETVSIFTNSTFGQDSYYVLILNSLERRNARHGYILIKLKKGLCNLVNIAH